MIQERDERFRLLAKSAPVLLWTSGADKRRTWFNEPWLRFVGRRMEQELGDGWAENLHPDDRDRCLEAYVTALDDRRPFSIEYRLKRHDAAYRWVLEKGVPLYGSGGEFTGYSGSCVDVTELKHAEAVALNSKDMLSLAMLGGRMGAWSQDLSTKAVWWSRELEDIFGLEHDGYERTEASFYALVHEDDRPALEQAFENAIDNHTDYEAEFRFRHASGEWRWMKDRGRVVYDEAGRPTMIYGLGIDVTGRKLAQLEQAHASAIISSSDDAVVSKTLDGVITSWNAAAQRMFGYTEAEAVGKRIDIIIPEDLLHEERQIIQRLRRGERIDHFETVRRTKDGRLFDISLTISPVKDASGRIVGASKIARDISDRRRAELERKDAERRKDEFLAILAHELRNPLAPVRNAAHYLKLQGPENPDLRRSIEMIDRQVTQMTRLIDDLLDVSRISRGLLELRRERFALTELVQSAVDATHDQIHAQGHSLRVNLPREPVELEADQERLIQVLSNLITNAAKYTPAGGQVEISAAASNGIFRLSVKDNGIGIPLEKLTKIFELFERVDSSLERQGGLGIGLTLARQITELHGGTIEARSEGIGRGSEFVLKLPLVVKAKEAVAAAGSEPGPAGTPRRILVADDNHDAVESLALLLQIAGHDVHTAFDGEAAITSAEENKPDVALLDIGMPKANGYEVARRIREHPWGKRIHLVALTGWGQEADKSRAKNVGFDTHLVKPVAPEALYRLLATI